MTANTKDGKELFRETKIYMPQSAIYGRDDFMWSGGAFPGWKAGMLRDTSLQPGKGKCETFEIAYPYEDIEQEGKTVRKVMAHEMDVTVKLWYLPIGGDPRDREPGKTAFLFYETTETIKLEPNEY